MTDAENGERQAEAIEHCVTALLADAVGERNESLVAIETVIQTDTTLAVSTFFDMLRQVFAKLPADVKEQPATVGAGFARASSDTMTGETKPGRPAPSRHQVRSPRGGVVDGDPRWWLFGSMLTRPDLAGDIDLVCEWATCEQLDFTPDDDLTYQPPAALRPVTQTLETLSVRTGRPVDVWFNPKGVGLNPAGYYDPAEGWCFNWRFAGRWFFHAAREVDLAQILPELPGKTVGQAPEPCHGDMLARLAEELP